VVKVNCTQCTAEFEMDITRDDVEWVFYKRQLLATDCSKCKSFTVVDVVKLHAELQGK
jgi:hypothetical protein